MAGQPTEEDRTEAIQRLLSGLERGSDAHELAAAVADLDAGESITQNPLAEAIGFRQLGRN